MPECEQPFSSYHEHRGGTTQLEMYEAGGEKGSGFHVFNRSQDHYHRTEALQRTGAIDITCDLVKVIHGAMAADSDRYATVVVMRWYFQPRNKRRISEATITLRFDSSSDDADAIEVERISFHDTYSVMPTTQRETTTKGGDINIGVDHVVNATIGGKWEKTVDIETSDAITLSGQRHLVNNRSPYRIATWTLSENASQPAGIPASLQVAILLSRQDRAKFYGRLEFSCRTDLKTAAESLFKKIPKDDPIIFQPNSFDKGTRPKYDVRYDDDDLGRVDIIDGFSDVTFRTIIGNAEKKRE